MKGVWRTRALGYACVRKRVLEGKMAIIRTCMCTYRITSIMKHTYATKNGWMSEVTNMIAICKWYRVLGSSSFQFLKHKERLMEKLRNWSCGKESTVKWGTEKAGGESAMKNLFAVLQLKPAPCGFRGGAAMHFRSSIFRQGSFSLYILQRSFESRLS